MANNASRRGLGVQVTSSTAPRFRERMLPLSSAIDNRKQASVSSACFFLMCGCGFYSAAVFFLVMSAKPKNTQNEIIDTKMPARKPGVWYVNTI